MADFEGVALQMATGSSAGAVLYLAEPAEDADLVRLAGNAEVAILAGMRAIVVRGLPASAYETVMQVAPETCNQALDVLAISGKARMTLSEVETTHVAWWDDGLAQTVRLVGTSTMTGSTSPVSLTVYDGSGNVIPPVTPPPVVWHDSFRYFRMSQTSADLFDAFRNVYLALESVLSTIEPVQVKGNGHPEGEGVWIERALTTAAGQVRLADYLPAPSPDPVAGVKAELYTRIRTSIFHAKNGRPVLLPQDLAHRGEVGDALARYVRMYIDLVGVVLGVRYLSGGLTVDGFTAMTSSLLDASAIHVTDDAAPADPSDTQVAPGGGTQMKLPTTRWAHLNQPFFAAVGASVPAGDIVRTLGSVRRFCTTLPGGKVGQIETLEGALHMDGFDVIECVIGMRMINARSPKGVYAT